MPEPYTAQAGVLIDAAATRFVNDVAERFFKVSGKSIAVTSAYRGPDKQAAAMQDKFLGSASHIYRDKVSLGGSGLPICAVSPLANRAQTVAGMSKVIADQVGRHRYISNHLVATAIDLRKRDLSRNERKALMQAARDAGAKVVIDEGQPPHRHIQS